MTPKLRIDRAPPRSNLVVGQARINRTGLARPGLSRLQIGLGVPVARTALGVPARGLNRPLLAALCRRLAWSDVLAGFQASLFSGPVLSSLAAAMVGACSMARVDRCRIGLVGWIGAQGLGRVALAGVVVGLRMQCRHAPQQHHHGLAADAAPGRTRWHRRLGCHRAQVQHLQHADGTRAVVMQISEVARSAQAQGPRRAAAPATGSLRRPACAGPSCRSWRHGTGRRSCLSPLAPALHAGYAIQASH